MFTFLAMYNFFSKRETFLYLTVINGKEKKDKRQKSNSAILLRKHLYSSVFRDALKCIPE